MAYVGSWDGNVYAVAVETGEQQWGFKTGDKADLSPTVADAVVYIGSTDRHVYGLDADLGQPL